MTSTLVLKAGFATGAAMLALSVSPAMAGRCGHSYPVDAPVTLAKVARACNVSLAALKEANPGVDPSYVTPGEHLAVPDEIDSATDIPSGAADVAIADDGYGSARVYRYVEYTEPAHAPKAPSAVYASSSASPYFVRTSAYSSPQPFRDDANLSYQKLSAARIRHAGIPIGPLLQQQSADPNAFAISTDADLPAVLYGEPLSPLMECSVLRRQENGRIKQVREIKPISQGRDLPAHCDAIQTISTRSAAPGAVFSGSAYQALQVHSDMAVMEGYVSAADAECVTVQTDNGSEMRVGVDLAPVELLGKYATIWAEQTSSKRCGGLVMSRAVYVERLR